MSYEQNVRKVVPYVPGEQPAGKRVIKLNTNENPYPPAPGVQTAMQSYDCGELRKYPDPKITLLVHELAEYYGVEDNQVFAGVGSDDVLAMAFLTFFNSDKPILFADITYSFYDVWADLFKIPYKTCPLDENFQLKKEDYYIENGGIVLANPNAPTGVLQPLSVIEDILQHNPDVAVIVDEAYVDFGGESCLTLLPRYENLLVVQTFSKSRSMAGMRIGFAIGNEKMIKYLNDVKFSINSYTMSSPVIRLSVEAIRDDAYFMETRGKIIATREWAKKELETLGFSFQDSMANFIFATHKEVPASEIYKALKEKEIYVRYFKEPRIDNYLRISIGTEEEMQHLFEALRQIIWNDSHLGKVQAGKEWKEK